MMFAYLSFPQKREHLFYIVAIGASAGGLESAIELFSHLPDKTGMCYFYIQDAHPIKNNVVTSLQAVTNMPVLPIANGYPVLPDHLYIIPPDKEITIRRQEFVIRPLTYDSSQLSPADRLFKELAATFSKRTIGIVLSGLSPDGAAGLQAIQAAGGRTFVHDRSAARMAWELDQIRLRFHPWQPGNIEVHEPEVTQAHIPQTNTTHQQVHKTLQTLSTDLQQFTYVASHDLQEPLRKIITFSDRLKQRFIELLPDAGKSYIDKIITSALHMSQLLDDLLNYSKISEEAAAFAKTNLNEIMERLLRKLQDIIQEKQAGISYMSLPVLECVPHQLEILLHQLIDNALKFAHPDRRPEITVMSRPLKQEKLQQYPMLNKSLPYYEIIISDNGIGFKPEFAEQIFVIFQRLNDKTAFPGTGIGLALCRKIAVIHSGEIYVESKEGSGSAFHIILPARQP